MQPISKPSVTKGGPKAAMTKMNSTRQFFAQMLRAFLFVMFGALALSGCGDGGSPIASDKGNDPAATLTSIEVTPANASVAVASMAQLTATGIYSDNTRADITSQVSWASTDATTVSVDAAGMAKGEKAGSASVSASLNGVTGNTTVTVTPATLVSIAVTPGTASIALAATQAFTATGTFSDNTTQPLTSGVTWASATAATASINSAGVASALAAGTTAITASMNGVTSAPVTLTVNPATLVSIAVTPAAPSVIAGLTQAFVATGTYSDNSTQTITGQVTWASATQAAATIDAAGLATGVAAGSSVITATMNGIVSPGQTLTVNAATLLSIAITPANTTLDLAVTSQQPMVATGTYDNNTTQVITDTVVWSSSDVAVVVVSNATGSQGVAIAQAPGAATVSAASGAIVAPPVNVTVTP